MDGLDRTAYRLRFSSIDEARGTAEVRTTQAADAIEWNSDGKWEPLEAGDLVLLRWFDVEKKQGMKLEPQWEGPYRLVQMAWHGRSGRLQDIQTGDLVQVKKGGLKERVHVNHLKLFCPRNVDKVAVMESSLVELATGEAEWEIGRRDFTLGDD